MGAQQIVRSSMDRNSLCPPGFIRRVGPSRPTRRNRFAAVINNNDEPV
ncbi:MAG TPA: hypothetical protein VKB86_13185 [Pyrinomonadaceae bacterium]|nr:hypothetical protein [Pyrinomonadaceae bacterium]